MNDLQDLQHFALFTTVQAVDDDYQTSATMRERVNCAQCVSDQVDFLFQLENEAFEL
jgi:hypothetical protein